MSAITGYQAVGVVEEGSSNGSGTIFEATGITDCIDPALERIRRDPRFVFRGDCGDRCQQAVLKQIPGEVSSRKHALTHVVGAGDVPDLYYQINDGDVSDAIDWAGVAP